jgi:amino acid transporter
LILFTSGFSTFTKGNWNTATFISAYLSVAIPFTDHHSQFLLTDFPRDIPLVLCAFTLWKVTKKTKFVSLNSVDLDAAFNQAEILPETLPEKTVGWLRFVSWIWD